MLANFDRILREIRAEAEKLAPPDAVEEIVKLSMNIVDFEDQHRLRPRAIRKDVENLLLSYAEHIREPAK